MLTLFRVFTAAHARQAITIRRSFYALAAFLLTALSQGCTTVPPTPLAGHNPVEAQTPVPATRYRSTIGPYVRQRPAEPAPWREQNDRVAPVQKP